MNLSCLNLNGDIKFQLKAFQKQTNEYLNNLPENVQEIDLSNQLLLEVPDLSRFVCLKRLNLRGNLLKYKIKNIPDTVEYIDLSDNVLCELFDVIPKSLIVLIVKDNTTLQILPNNPNKNIIYVDCSYTEIKSIPENYVKINITS